MMVEKHLPLKNSPKGLHLFSHVVRHFEMGRGSSYEFNEMDKECTIWILDSDKKYAEAQEQAMCSGFKGFKNDW